MGLTLALSVNDAGAGRSPTTTSRRRSSTMIDSELRGTAAARSEDGPLGAAAIGITLGRRAHPTTTVVRTIAETVVARTSGLMVVSSLSQSRTAREVIAGIVTVASRDEGPGRSHFRKNAISA